jgi:C4-type Zn-finger protein
LCRYCRKKPEELDFHNREVIDLRNTTTNKHCLKRKFDVVKGRTCDIKNPALQAAVEGGTLSASFASLACGYENQALRATGEDVITATFFAR